MPRRRLLAAGTVLAANFTDLRVKAALLEQRVDQAAAEPRRSARSRLANEAELYTYGYLLMGQGRLDSAIAIFRKNTRDYPKSSNSYDSLGEAYARKGDRRQAAVNYSRALALMRNDRQKKRIAGVRIGLR